MKQLKSLIAAFALSVLGTAAAKAQTVPYDPYDSDMPPVENDNSERFISQAAVEYVARTQGVDEVFPRVRVGFSSGFYGNEYIGLEWALRGGMATVVNAYNLNNFEDQFAFDAIRDRARQLELTLEQRNVPFTLYTQYRTGHCPQQNNWYSPRRSHNHFYYDGNNSGYPSNNGYNNHYQNNGGTPHNGTQHAPGRRR